MARGTILNVIAPVPPAPPRPAPDPELAELQARAAQLQARAASGCKGCVAARRELQAVRHAILARSLGRGALCRSPATTA